MKCAKCSKEIRPEDAHMKIEIVFAEGIDPKIAMANAPFATLEGRSAITTVCHPCAGTLIMLMMIGLKDIISPTADM